MTSAEKISAYYKLVEDVKNCNMLSDCNSSNKGIILEKCPDCNEINLWSYWQGGIDHLNAKILLVGQDWGNYNDSQFKPLLDLIRLYNKDHSKSYDYLKDNHNPTDENLCKLFNSIGIDITSPNTDVFFTNFVLCYRSGSNGISGGFKQRLATNCSPYFNRLVQIIEPNVIICLGKSVFNNVLKTAGLKIPRLNYNEIIESGSYDATFGEHNCKVFPVAHCGVLGTNNRNKNRNYDEKLDIQKTDWSKIKRELQI